MKGYETLTLAGATPLGGRFNVACKEHGFSVTISETREGIKVIAGNPEFYDASNALSEKAQKELNEAIFKQAFARSIRVIEERTSEGDPDRGAR